jgi:hypothetical protein
MTDQTGEYQLWQEFEKLCKLILEYRGLKIVNTALKLDRVYYDYYVTRDGKQGYVEIKLYRSTRIPPDTLRRAAELLNTILNKESASLLLIVSTDVQESLKKELYDKYKVHVWDIRTLFHLTIDNADLYHSLSAIFVKATNQQAGELSIVDTNKPEDFVTKFIDSSPLQNSSIVEIEKIGEKLCKELEKIERGNYGDYEDEEKSALARQYEVKCSEIIKYLFEDDLEILKEQNHTDGNLHIFDLICRIASQHNFWQDLSKDFHTRYIIFEYKNYEKKIKQGQIYTTEKYLFTKALRSIGFIISREGPDKNAQIAAKGALRENGKLIVNLTDNDLCEMLKLKDNSDDYTEVLIKKIDDMLIKITR